MALHLDLSAPVRRLVVVLVVLVSLLASCGDGGGEAGDGGGVDAGTAPSSAQGTTTDVFPEDALPAGSSGTLVAGRGPEPDVCQGWGEADREAGAPADCDTVYDLMSMTKQFTAAAVVKLQMEGRLSVDDTIGDLLPGVPDDRRDITVEQLLTHTSGLPDSLGDDYEPLSRDDLLGEVFAVPLESEPGSTYLYSNAGYSLLAAIVEEVSGVDYETFLAQELFGPAGMTMTGYVLPDWSSAEVAVEYDPDGEPKGTPLEHPWAEDGPYWNLRGNGGLLSTARDLYRWHVALLGDDILDDAAKQELFQPRVREVPDDTFYAYGWVVLDPDGEQVLWHNGGNGWSYGEIARDPDGDRFVFWVTNQARDDAAGWDLEETGPLITETLMRQLD